jgi:hypothetical protein
VVARASFKRIDNSHDENRRREHLDPFCKYLESEIGISESQNGISENFGPPAAPQAPVYTNSSLTFAKYQYLLSVAVGTFSRLRGDGVGG